MAIKVFSEIVQSLMAYIQATHPEANLTTGSLQRDVLIDAPASELSELYGEVRIAQDAQSVRDASGSHLDRLLANWALYRRPGTVATGSVWFQRRTAPAVNIIIPSGTRVKTTTTVEQDAIEFITTQTVTMLAALASNYYNEDEDLYEIEASVEAAYSGWEGNVGPNTITAFVGTADIDSCTNRTATSGGTDYEADTVMRTRGASVLAGVNTGTRDGYEVLIEGQPYVDEAIVVTPNDDEMERVLYGGGADIWIKTDQIIETTESYTYATGEENRALTGPVAAISSVTENSVLLTPGVDYNLVLDSGVYGRSFYSNDRVAWITARVVGAAILITYTRCDLIQTLQDTIDSTTNHIVGADILVKLCYSAFVDVTMIIEVLAGYDLTDVASSVNISITSYIDGLELGEAVQQSDIIALAEFVAGVDSVVLPLTTFQITRELTGTIDGTDEIEGASTGASTGNLITRKFEYAESNAIQINTYSS